MAIRELQTIELAGTDILFHVTSLTSAVSILKSNRFELKPSEGTSAEEQLSKGKYYLSTTRSKLGSYTQQHLGSYTVLFVLDGKKLGHRYKVLPVDYWDTNKGDSADKMFRRSSHYESEDRVVSDDPFIVALPYIKAIHVAYPGKQREPLLFALHKKALLNHIPFFVYTDSKALLLMDTRRAVKVDYTKVLPEQKPPSAYDYKYRLRNNDIKQWLQLWTYPLVIPKDGWAGSLAKKISDRTYTAYQTLRYDDAINVFSADLHNTKSTPYEDPSQGREALDKLIGVMRKAKLTPKEFIEALRKKWYPEIY
jgi:hypothetical protein